jgi:hypothetical protein
MTSWTPTARQELENHLAGLRRSLDGSGADPDEVLEDVRRHVVEEAAAARLPVVTEADVRRFPRAVGAARRSVVRFRPIRPGRGGPAGTGIGARAGRRTGSGSFVRGLAAGAGAGVFRGVVARVDPRVRGLDPGLCAGVLRSAAHRVARVVRGARAPRQPAAPGPSGRLVAGGDPGPGVAVGGRSRGGRAVRAVVPAAHAVRDGRGDFRPRPAAPLPAPVARGRRQPAPAVRPGNRRGATGVAAGRLDRLRRSLGPPGRAAPPGTRHAAVRRTRRQRRTTTVRGRGVVVAPLGRSRRPAPGLLRVPPGHLGLGPARTSARRNGPGDLLPRHRRTVQTPSPRPSRPGAGRTGSSSTSSISAGSNGIRRWEGRRWRAGSGVCRWCRRDWMRRRMPMRSGPTRSGPSSSATTTNVPSARRGRRFSCRRAPWCRA